MSAQNARLLRQDLFVSHGVNIPTRLFAVANKQASAPVDTIKGVSPLVLPTGAEAQCSLLAQDLNLFDSEEPQWPSLILSIKERLQVWHF